VDRVEAALAAARAGRGGVALIEAAAGFGKSTLVRELRERGRRHGCRQRGGAMGRAGLRLWGVVELFESTGHGDPAERERFLSAAAREAVPIFTSGERVIEPTFDVLHGLYRLCKRLADSRPLAILVDDLDLAEVRPSDPGVRDRASG
jgi:AAA ATPase-like protein